MDTQDNVGVVDAPVSVPGSGKTVKKAPKAPKKKAAATKKAAAPKKKAAVKKAAGKSGPRAKKDGLRKPQVRILQALAKTKVAGGQLTRAQIAEQGPVDVAACVEYIGSLDKSIREANDKKHFPSLISLGFVKHEENIKNNDSAGPTLYNITAAGRKALEAALKE